MNGPAPQDDEMAGLATSEAAELEPIAQALRAERPRVDEAAFFDALHQRIMNEVAVTPLPGGRERGRRPGPASGWRRLGRGAWRGRLVSLALGAAAVAALTLLVLTRDHPQEPLRNLPGPSTWAALNGGSDGPAVLNIPDELWQDGFFAHQSVPSADLGTALEDPDGGLADASESRDESDADWLAADWLADDLDELDPFAADLDWGLGALDEDELRRFDELLGG